MPTTDNDYWNNPPQPAHPAQHQQQQPPQAAQPQQPAQPQPAQYQQQPQPAPAAYVQRPAKAKSHGWIVAIVVVVCVCALLAFSVHSCSSAMTRIAGGSLDTSYDLQLTGDTVAIIDIDGTIQYNNSACSPEGLKELLDQAEGNPNIKAVVLRVNSGGGTATAGEEMAEYVRQFSEVKPIVVSSASINASAAYEISSQADYIYVAKSSEIGAIGTAMELTNYAGLLELLGIEKEVITSADEKDSSYGYRALTDDEREQYQDMVDQINEVFIQNVIDGRGMDEASVRALATGMPFTGTDAVANGLADEVGTREDAIAKAAELAGIADYDTTTLSISTYDLSALSYLLGSQDRASVEELLDLLESQQGSSLR